MDRYDVVIVGAGPTGLATAIECGNAGLSRLVLEKGCLVNSIFHYPTNMVFFTTPELLEIGDIPMNSLRDKPTRVEALKYYRRVSERYRLPVRLYERVERVEGSDGDFRVFSRKVQAGPSSAGGHSDPLEGARRANSAEDRCEAARKVVLATGNYDRPNRLGVPGEELDKVSHYYREAHPYYDRDVAVVGGKNSAAEAALDLYRQGARVTLIHRGEGLSPSIKYWVKPDLENRVKNGQIQARFRTSVTEIRPDCLRLRGPDGESWLKNDFVLALIGYHPDLNFLGRLGIQVDPTTGRPYCNPETLETNVAGIYLAGVLIAGTRSGEIFIENGRFHGRQIAADLARKL